MVSTRQAAERLGVSVRQVQRYVREEKLVAQQLGDHPAAPWVITDESLEQLLAERGERPRRSYTRRQHDNAAPATAERRTG